MRVLVTTDAVGGVWTVTRTLARHLVRRDVTVDLVVLGPDPDEREAHRVERLEGVHLHHHPGRLEWMPGSRDDVKGHQRFLHGLAQDVEPDVVHVNGYAEAAAGFDVPVLVEAHSDVVSWWHHVHGSDPPPRYDPYRRGVQEGLDAADLVVAPTRAYLDEVARHFRITAPKRVVRNARDPSAFPPGDAEPYVAAVGRLWDEAKNLRALDEAAEGLPWPVRVAGPAEAPDDGLADAEGPPPGGGTAEPRPRRGAEFLGRLPQDELRELLADASIFAHPSLYEPFGLAPLEAGLAGCALVLSDLPTLREVWGEAALYVDPHDPQEIRSTLTTLARDPVLLRRYRDRARIRALRYDPRRQAEEFHRAYAVLAPDARADAAPADTDPRPLREATPWTS